MFFSALQRKDVDATKGIIGEELVRQSEESCEQENHS